MFGGRNRLDAEPLSARTGRWLWITIGLDTMALVWMIAAGEWLDGCSPCRVLTLGGHHELVLVLLLVALIMLAGLAVLTEGFTFVTRRERIALVATCVLSLVALAGPLSLALLFGYGALIFRAISPRR